MATVPPPFSRQLAAMSGDNQSSQTRKYDHIRTNGYLLENYDLLVSCEVKRKRSMPSVLKLSRLTIFFVLVQSFAGTTADYYAGYIHSIIKNETESACEGGYLRIQCPVMTTITIQGAMYGRKVPSSEMCPITPSLSAQGLLAEDVNCESVTSMAKTATECEDRRVCQLLVHAKVFGDDPCPNTTKYLTVKYKCRLMPDELRTRASCHDTTMRLRCPRKRTFIAIYDVKLERTRACDDYISENCTMTSDDALDYVTKRCHRQQKCVLPGSTHTCGNFFHVEYACLPKRILTDEIPSSVLSAVPSSSDVIDDLTETLSTTTLSTAESGEIPIVPKIVPVGSALETASTVPPRSSSTPTTRPTLSSTFPSVQPQSTLTTIATKQQVLKVEDQTSLARVPGEGTFRNEKDAKVPFQTSTVALKTSKKKVTNAVKSTNEFPIPGEEPDDNIAIAAEATQPNSGQNMLNFTISQEYASNATALVAGVLSNSTMPQGVIFITVLAQLLAYFHENSDRILLVVLGSLCIGLFLAVIFLLFRCDEKRGFCGRKSPEEDNAQSREGECASLMGTSHRSQTESSSTNPGNIFNTHPPPTFPNHHGNHVDYISRVQGDHRRRKRRSKTQTLLKKCCSCCCTNAPWQRDHSDSEDGYRIPARASSASDDEVISVVGSNRNQFEGPLPHAPPSARLDEMDGDNRFPPITSSGPVSDGIPYVDDNTSEYEFQDNNPSPSTARSAQEPPPLVRPTTLQTTFRSAPIASQIDHQTFNRNGALHFPIPVTQSSYQRPTQRQQPVYDPPNRQREPPPFPKPVTYGYQPQNSQHSPHYTNQRTSYSQRPFQPQPTRTAQQPVPNHISQQRHPQAYIPSIGDPYVSLRPQQQQQNTARTVNLIRNEAIPERRRSVYDNSLPRDSPMYEYYQRQQITRQELPGTRNINQYYP